MSDAKVSDKSKALFVNGEAHAVATMSQAQLDRWTQECLATFPIGRKYQVIYADPPWQYSHMPGSEGLTPYPTMTIDDLKRLPVPQVAADTSALFLWVTNPLLRQGLDLMHAWGFEYKTVFKVWCKRFPNGKPVSGCGWWSRPSTEMVLVGTRGKGYMQWKQTYSEPQEFEGLRRRHSEKPDEIRESIRTFFDVPGMRRLELFARTKGAGFDAWGLEVPGFLQVDSAADEEEPPPPPATDETDLEALVRRVVRETVESVLTGM